MAAWNPFQRSLHRRPNRKRSSFRTVHFEPLEDRTLLSVLFEEPFNTDTASTAETLSVYSDFDFVDPGGDPVIVDGGVLQFPVQTGPQHDFILTPTFSGNLKIEVDVGKTPGGGNFHVGLRIGDNRLVFHPGFIGDTFNPPGSFRVEGPGGFANDDIGFIPAGGVLHHLEVTVFASSGDFQIELTDGNDPSNVYHASFTNPAYAPGVDKIGLIATDAPGMRVGHFDNLVISSAEHSLPGVFRNGLWFLRDSSTSGPGDTVFQFGLPGDQPVMGDWDGDGVKTPGVFRDGIWFLRNSNTTGIGELAFAYGLPGDKPVVGDWDGDGIDTPGVVRDNLWFLRNTNSTGMGEVVFTYGAIGDTPVVGDWDGDGIDTPGVVRDNLWFLRNSSTTGMAEAAFAFAPDGERPVVGDWDGDGTDTPGVIRNETWMVVRSHNDSGFDDLFVADQVFAYGDGDDVAVVWGMP